VDNFISRANLKNAKPIVLVLELSQARKKAEYQWRLGISNSILKGFQTHHHVCDCRVSSATWIVASGNNGAWGGSSRRVQAGDMRLGRKLTCFPEAKGVVWLRSRVAS